MYKQITVKLLILMAGILLLVHAVIPHLHYNAEIFIIHKTNLSHSNHNHNPSNPDDQCHTNSEFCLLKQVFLVRSENLIPNYFQQHTENQPDNDMGFQAIISTFDFKLTIPPLASPPDKEKFFNYSFFYSGSTSSRGSPVV